MTEVVVTAGADMQSSSNYIKNLWLKAHANSPFTPLYQITENNKINGAYNNIVLLTLQQLSLILNANSHEQIKTCHVKVQVVL